MTTRQEWPFGMEHVAPCWWQHEWDDEMGFAVWLKRWHAIDSLPAALGHLEGIFDYGGQTLDAAQFLFHHMKDVLPIEATRQEAWQHRPRPAVLIQNKAKELFFLRFLRERDRESERGVFPKCASVFVRDAEEGGTLFRDLMRYLERNRYGALDDETHNLLSVARKMLKAAYKFVESEGDGEDKFCALRDAHLTLFYRAIIAYGMADIIERYDELSLKALREIVFASRGFPDKVPSDLVEAAESADRLTGEALARLMHLQLVSKAQKRKQRREVVERRISILERELKGPPATVEVPVKKSPRELAQKSRELARLKAQAAKWAQGAST